MTPEIHYAIIIFLLIPIINIVFYLIFHKIFNFDIEVLLYGIGFTLTCQSLWLLTLCSYALFLAASDPTNGIDPILLFCMITPIFLLFYSQAIFKKNIKMNNKIPQYLILIATIMLVFEMILEIIRGFSIFPFVYFLFIFVIPCSIFSVMKSGTIKDIISGRIQLSFRELSWIPFIMHITLIWIICLSIIGLAMP